MTKTFILKIFDTLFIAFSAFLIFFVILNYFLDKAYALCLAISFSLVVATFSFKSLTEKNQDKLIKKKHEKDLERVCGSLCFLGTKELNNVFSKLFSDCEKKKGGFYDPESKTLHLYFFKFEGLTKTDIVKAYNKITKNERAIIYTAYCDEKTLDFSHLFGNKIEVVYYEKVYELLKNANLLDEVRRDLNFSLPKKKGSFKGFLNKKRAKKFFAFGAVFLLLSFIVPFKLYYIISGAIFIILSLLSKFFGKNDIPVN